MFKKLMASSLSAVLIAINILMPSVSAQVIEFQDVAEDSWFWSDVQLSCSYNLFKETGNNEFSPQNSITRGQFVAALGQLHEQSGLSEIKESNQIYFNDVDTNSYYAKYINWAASNKIVSGYDNSLFAPNDYITKEQSCVILNNYIKYANIELLNNGKTEVTIFPEFKDALSISNWAFDAVMDMQSYSIIFGSDDGNFYPRNNATRAEAATIYVKFYNLIKDKTLFSYDVESIEKITLHNGSNGNVVTIEDRDEIAEIIDTLNSFRYNIEEMKRPSTGWTFAIKVYENNSTESLKWINISDSTIVMDDIIYYSEINNYFERFIQKWIPN